MIITRTPVRVSLLGGGSDYPDHFRRQPGQTLGIAIDKYSYVTVNRLAPLFDYTIRVSYSRTELVSNVDDLAHPAVRECLRFLGIAGGVEIGYAGDLPARTGLGSSSSFTVALLHALHAFKGELVCHRQLAEEAVIVEQERIRERVGIQDQYTCAYGGLLHLSFGPSGVMPSPVPLSRDRLDALRAHLLLLYTGVQRNAHDVLDEQLDRTRTGALDGHLEQLTALAAEGLELIAGSRPLHELGRVLDAAWTIKRGLSSKISNPAIDAFYSRARSAGAAGGKLLGAGGGGFLLLLVPPEHRREVLTALPELTCVDFGFDFSGSTLLFYQPQ